MMLHVKFEDDKRSYSVDKEEQATLPKNNNYNELTIEGFSSAQELQKIIAEIIDNNITCKTLILKDNEFGGNVCCDALIRFIHASQKTLKAITIEDTDDCMSNSDHARLSEHAKNIRIELPDKSFLVWQLNDDMSNFNQKIDPGLSEILKGCNYNITIPITTYFFAHSTAKRTSPEELLRNFFSSFHQQRTGVTCGAANVLMIMEYYNTLYDGMKNRPAIIIDEKFSSGPNDRILFGKNSKFDKEKELELVEQQEFPVIKSFQTMKWKEKTLADLFDTTDDGTDVKNMAESLEKQGFCTAYSADIVDKKDGEIQEELKNLLEKFKVLLKAGVPVVINHLYHMGEEDEEGHFSTIIGFENNKFILADPATRYNNKVEHITMSTEELINCWYSETGKVPGKYFVLFPSEKMQTQLLPELQPNSSTAGLKFSH